MTLCDQGVIMKEYGKPVVAKVLDVTRKIYVPNGTVDPIGSALLTYGAYAEHERMIPRICDTYEKRIC